MSESALHRNDRLRPLDSPRPRKSSVPRTRQHLKSKQPRILTRAIRDQLVVRAALHHSPRVQDDDLVAVSDRRQPVGDDQARAASPAEVVVDDPLGPGIKRARGLVEHRAGSVRRTSARAICSRCRCPPEKFRPASRDSRAVAAPPLKQVAVNRRLHPGLGQPLHRHKIVPERQVVAHRSLEQADLRVDQLHRVDEDLARKLRERRCRRRGSRRSRVGTAPAPAGRSSICRCPTRRPAQSAGRAAQQMRTRGSAVPRPSGCSRR